MQYIVFSIQAGIDNVELTNLLDHADNVWPADGQKHWRKGKSLYSGVRTPAPPYWITPLNLFYSNTPVYRPPGEYVVNPIYTRLVTSERKTVIPVNLTHYWENVDSFKFADSLKNDVCAIYVYSNNKNRLRTEISYNLEGTDLSSALSNIDTIDPLDQDLWSSLYPPGFNAVIEMDKIWTDWDYLNDILTGIGINLSKIEYDRYLSTFNRA